MSVRFIPDALSAEASPAGQFPSIPRLPPLHVRRPRLTQALLDSDCRLRLICAPAGFGKTVLMSECARQVPADTRLVWLDLGGRACTVEALHEQLGAALAEPAGGGSENDLLALLRRIRQPVWIMLDDYPRDSSPELDDCLDLLLDMGPSTVSWWVTSRRQPAWKLPRLLLQGHLFELEAEALAFTADELEQVLKVHRLALSPESFQQLQRVLEGWPAGVCLMLLNADEHALRERLLAGTPLLRDYVQREVMAGLSDEVRRALLALARMPRFSAELCDHVLDGVGREILDVLKTRQLFIRQIDNCGEWFRLWKPLALMLQRSAENAAPTQAHLRACQWLSLIHI